MKIEILAQGLTDLSKYLESVPDKAGEAARIAINSVARGKGRKLLIDRMMSEVSFPREYLDQDRLFFKKPASNNDLTAIIEARQRPTSLARFASGGAIGQRTGAITVRVKKGSGGRTFNTKPGGANAFLVRLRRGRALTEDRFNAGLALRLPEGQSLTGRKNGNTAEIFPNVFLLYGPSVDQVFRGVAEDLSDDIGALVETEFYRQFQRLVED
jgi:hypothetical protein